MQPFVGEDLAREEAVGRGFTDQEVVSADEHPNSEITAEHRKALWQVLEDCGGRRRFVPFDAELRDDDGLELDGVFTTPKNLTRSVCSLCVYISVFVCVLLLTLCTIAKMSNRRF